MSYSKITSDGKDLAYRFAPPQTDLDRTGKKTPIDERGYGPKFPEELSRFTSTVYYYWWEFLRLNADYIECCAREGQYDDKDPRHLHLRELYKDFGDVRDAYQGASTDDNFKEWWIRRGWLLFVEPNQQPDVKIQTRPFSDIHDHGDRIYLSMQRDMDPKALVKELKSYLHELHQQEPLGRDQHSKALYQPRHHKLIALAKYLAIKKAQIKHLNENNKRPTNEELMDLAGIEFMGNDHLFLNPDGTSYKHSGKRKAGAEAINAADNIIRYVAYGLFPITKSDYQFDQLSITSKLMYLPRASHYLRFSDKWLSAIGRQDKWFADLHESRRNIRQSLEHRLAGRNTGNTD